MEWVTFHGILPPAPDVLDAFHEEMDGYQYGVEETWDAFCWFRDGWLARTPESANVNATLALAIRHPGGMYFAGFGDARNPNAPKVKWEFSLAHARLFNGSARAQAEKYIERIKAKDALYLGLKVVPVTACLGTVQS